MNFQADWRNRRAQLLGPMQFSFANYYTDTPKTEMKNGFSEDLFHNLHLIPEPLKKNLADTLPTNQQDMFDAQPTMGAEYSRLSGIANFFSGVMSALSGAVFKRARSPDKVWQHANGEYKNGLEAGEANVAMSECETAAAACEDKLNRVRRLLANKSSPNRYLSRPRKVFVEPSHVEEHFEDAFSPEDFVGLPNDAIIEYFSPLQYQEQEFYNVDAAQVRVKTAPDLNDRDKVPEVSETGVTVSDNKNSTQIVSSCEDKLAKLKALLQNKKNIVKTTEIVPETPLEPVPIKPSKSIPITQPKDKKFKNPHRLCVDKRPKARMKQDIQEDMLFADEIHLDDSSVESSPSFHSLEKVPDPLNRLVSETPIGPQECIVDKISEPLLDKLELSDIPIQNGMDKNCQPSEYLDKSKQSHDTPQEYFDEISGRFRRTSVSSEDSFQIVFTDIPQRVRTTSDCDSEDSFIVFEESPDSCYTSNDVFGDSDSNSDSDSDCECDNVRLPQSLSRTVSNLADDSLYDEVDCARSEAVCCTGLLVDERKKALKKNLPAKKVRFSEAAPRVHVMRVWAFAARQARPGHWERFARDRERFQRRIADVDMAVSWVLKPQHRARVMFQRFMPWWNAQKRRELAEKKQREEEERMKELATDDDHTRNYSNTEKQRSEISEVNGSGEVNNEVNGSEIVSDSNEFKSDNTQNGLDKGSDADDSTVTNSECMCINGSNTKCGEVSEVFLDNVRSDAEIIDVKYESPKTIFNVASI